MNWSLKVNPKALSNLQNDKINYLCSIIKYTFARRVFDYTEEWRERAQRNSGNLLRELMEEKVPIPGR